MDSGNLKTALCCLFCQSVLNTKSHIFLKSSPHPNPTRLNHEEGLNDMHVLDFGKITIFNHLIISSVFLFILTRSTIVEDLGYYDSLRKPIKPR